MWLLTGEYPHSGGLHRGIVFDDERRFFRSLPESRDTRGLVAVTARLAGHGVRFARRSAALGGKSGRAHAASGRRVEENETAQRYEVVTGSFGLRTGFRAGRFVRIRSEGALPRGAGRKAASDGIGGIEASVPVELTGQFAFVGVLAFVDLVAVETEDASFRVRRRRYVGNGGVHEDIASFFAVFFIPQHDDGEHRIPVHVVRVGIHVRVTPLDDDGLLSGNREDAVVRSSGDGVPLDGKVASGVPVDRRRVGEVAEIVVVDVLRRKRADDRKTVGTVFRSEGACHVVGVFADLRLEFLPIDGLGVDLDSALQGRGKRVVALVRDRSPYRHFLAFGGTFAERAARKRNRGAFESGDSGKEAEARGVVSGIVDPSDAVVICGIVREVRAESEFSEAVSVRIRLNFDTLRHGLSGSEGGESGAKVEQYLLYGIRVRSHFAEVAANADVGEGAEIVRIMEREGVAVHREAPIHGVVLELELHLVPGVVGKRVEGFGRNDFHRRLESEVAVHARITHEVHAHRAGVRRVGVRARADVSGRTSVRVARRRREDVFETERREADLVLGQIGIRFERRYRRAYADGVHAVGLLGRARIVGVERISDDVARVAVTVPIVVDRAVLETARAQEFGTVVEFPTGSDGSESGNRTDDIAVRVFEFDAVVVRVRQVAHRWRARRGQRRIGIERRHSGDDGYRYDFGAYVARTVFYRDSDFRFALSVRVVRVDVPRDVPEIFRCRRRVGRLVEKFAVFLPGDGVVANSRCRIRRGLDRVYVSAAGKQEDAVFFREVRRGGVVKDGPSHGIHVSGDVADVHVDRLRSFSAGTSRSGEDVEYAVSGTYGFPGSGSRRARRTAEFHRVHVQSRSSGIGGGVIERDGSEFGVCGGVGIRHRGFALVVRNAAGDGERRGGRGSFLIVGDRPLGALEHVARFHRGGLGRRTVSRAGETSTGDVGVYQGLSLASEPDSAVRGSVGGRSGNGRGEGDRHVCPSVGAGRNRIDYRGYGIAAQTCAAASVGNGARSSGRIGPSVPVMATVRRGTPVRGSDSERKAGPRERGSAGVPVARVVDVRERLGTDGYRIRVRRNRRGRRSGGSRVENVPVGIRIAAGFFEFHVYGNARSRRDVQREFESLGVLRNEASVLAQKPVTAVVVPARGRSDAVVDHRRRRSGRGLDDSAVVLSRLGRIRQIAIYRGFRRRGVILSDAGRELGSSAFRRIAYAVGNRSGTERDGYAVARLGAIVLRC